MQILVHNLHTGEFSRIDGKDTLQETLKQCQELNKVNEKIKHYPIKDTSE